jgi:hypothetical protein
MIDTLSSLNLARFQELVDSAPEVIQPILLRKGRERAKAAKAIGLIPDEAYEVVTELTMGQKGQLHNSRCPIKGHDHRLEVLYTASYPDTAGQLISRLACHQGATYRWELVHGVVCSLEPTPHWGFSKTSDRPLDGMKVYNTKDYL